MPSLADNHYRALRVRDERPLVWPDDRLDLIGIRSANDGKLDVLLGVLGEELSEARIRGHRVDVHVGMIPSPSRHAAIKFVVSHGAHCIPPCPDGQDGGVA